MWSNELQVTSIGASHGMLACKSAWAHHELYQSTITTAPPAWCGPEWRLGGAARFAPRKTRSTALPAATQSPPPPSSPGRTVRRR